VRRDERPYETIEDNDDNPEDPCAPRDDNPYETIEDNDDNPEDPCAPRDDNPYETIEDNDDNPEDPCAPRDDNPYETIEERDDTPGFLDPLTFDNRLPSPTKNPARIELATIAVDDNTGIRAAPETSNAYQ
jgi:hypothetical protein